MTNPGEGGDREQSGQNRPRTSTDELTVAGIMKTSDCVTRRARAAWISGLASCGSKRKKKRLEVEIQTKTRSSVEMLKFPSAQKRINRQVNTRECNRETSQREISRSATIKMKCTRCCSRRRRRQWRHESADKTPSVIQEKAGPREGVGEFYKSAANRTVPHAGRLIFTYSRENLHIRKSGRGLLLPPLK